MSVKKALNRSFRVVWNNSMRLWVVASELAKGKRKSSCRRQSPAPASMLSLLGVCLLAALPPPAVAEFTATVNADETVQNEILERDDTQTIKNRGTAIGSMLNSGAAQIVSSGGQTQQTQILGGAQQTVLTGGQASGSLLSGINALLTTSSGGVVISALVGSGGRLAVTSGGVAVAATVISGGTQLVSGYGSALGTLLTNGGTLSATTLGSIASGIIQQNGGALVTTTNATVTGSNSLGTFFIDGSTKTANNVLLENGGSLIVNAAASATSTTINLGGMLTVVAGGVATGVTQNSGGALNATTNTAVSGTNTLGNFSINSATKTASGVLLESTGALLIVSSGGQAFSTTLKNSGVQNINSGGSTSNTQIMVGGRENVLSGGTASGNLIQDGGVLNVATGASALGVTQQAGGIISASVATGGSTMTGINALGSNFSINGGTANNFVIASGGLLFAGAGTTTTNLTQQQGGGINVNMSANISGTNALGAFTVAGGVANNVLLENSGLMSAGNGQTAINTTVGSGGQLAIGLGTLNGATISSGGIFNITQVGNGTNVNLLNGSIIRGNSFFTGFNRITGTNVYSLNGVDVSGTFSIDAPTRTVSGIVLDNGARYSVGGLSTVSATTILSGGTLVANAVNNPTATGIKQLSGGIISASLLGTLNGTNPLGTFFINSATKSASNVLLESGGLLIVNSGGTATSTTAYSGGTVNVTGGGSTQGSQIYGMENLSAGSQANATAIYAGGVQTVRAAAQASSTVINSGGQQTVSGVANQSLINSGGEQVLFSGALANTTAVTGGLQRVSAGALASATQINQGGRQFVSSGGLASATQINAGASQIVSGGSIVIDSTINNGGLMDIYGGSISTNVLQNSGGAINVDTDADVTGTNRLGSFTVTSAAHVADNVLLENAGAQLYVYRGAIANNTTVSEQGELLVYDGATLTGTTLIEGTGKLTGEAVQNNGELRFSQSVDSVVQAVISGSGNLTQAGTATLTLEQAQSFTGQATIESGTLKAGTANVLASANALIMSGGTFDAGGLDQSVASLAGNGQVLLGANTLTLTNSNPATSAATYAGSLSGTGGLVKNGNYEQTLSGLTGYSGSTIITAGTLILDGANGGAQLVSDVFGTLGSRLSLQNGASLTGAIDPLDVDIDASSTWTLTGNSLIATLINAGTIDFQAPQTGTSYLPKVLTVTNLIGSGGVITLNSVLADNSSPTDQIVVDGGQVTGNTALNIRNAGGLGGPTSGDGIELVSLINGAQSQSNAFQLQNVVLAGAYQYSLRQGLNSPDWFLTSDQVIFPTPDVPPTPYGPPNLDTAPPPRSAARPNYRAEVSLDSVAPSLGLDSANTLLSSLHERRGGTATNNAGLVDPGKILWSRIVNSRERNDGAHEGIYRGAADYDAQINALQIGSDLFGRQTADFIERAGLYGAIGRSSARVEHHDGSKAGDLTLDSYSLGAYWTRFWESGWYTDATVQASFNDLASKSTNGLRLKTEGWGIGASLEGGYRYALSQTQLLEPQVQLSVQTLSLDKTHDPAAEVRFDAIQSLLGRAGVRLEQTWGDGQQPLSAWIRPSVVHEFKANPETRFQQGHAAVDFESDRGGSALNLTGGLTGEINKSLGVGLQVSYEQAISGNKKQAYGGQLELTYKF